MNNHPEQLFNRDNSATESMASGVCDRVKEDFSLELKALNMDEKDYIVHLSCVHLQLAHQRNQLLHWFYLPAMVAFAARNCKQPVSEGMYMLLLLLVVMVVVMIVLWWWWCLCRWWWWCCCCYCFRGGCYGGMGSDGSGHGGKG